MRFRKRFVRICVCLVACGFLVSPILAAEQSAGQQPARFEKLVPVAFDYLLFLPEGYDDRESWPLMLFLHGAGERGDNLDLVKKHGPPKILETSKALPFIVVSPQCPAGRRWEPFDLTALLDDVVARYKVDQDRIYVTGLSLGGYGTWALAARTPDRFAAIVPICGGGEPSWARRLAKVPVWVFHGAKDTAVPIGRSEEMVEALKAAGGNVQFTIYPEAGHDSWTETYDNPKLYEWLLEQKRTP